MQELVHRYLALGRWALGREVLESFGELMHDRVEPVYTEDVLGERSASSRRTLTVTVQTCGDLRDIRPLVEGQPSTAFPLQTAFVPSNVNSYALPPTIRSRVIRLSLRGAQPLMVSLSNHVAISLRLSTCRGTIIATATRLPRCARNDMRKTERPCHQERVT